MDVSFICHTIECSHQPRLIHQYAVRLVYIYIEEGGCGGHVGSVRARGKCLAWSSPQSPLRYSIRMNPSPGRGGGDREAR